MKYIRTFEINNNVNQQPFYLSKGDVLYVSDDFAYKKIKLSKRDIIKFYKNKNIQKLMWKYQEQFFNEDVDEKGRKLSTTLDTLKHVRFNNMYRMNIKLNSLGNYSNREAGKFKFYIGGESGDFYMHGKNMIRATRECNLNFIELYYPIVKYIKDFYKKLKNGELFLDIIRNSVHKNPEIAKYGIPDELQDELGHYEASIKYNL